METGCLFREIMAKNFIDPGRDLDIHVHEVHRSLSKMKLKDPEDILY